ncbi:DNA-binding barrel domain superfamily [Sesbania bispinosa]|nr:DNA-binding barrel domain superfamily [Sesbania bispinosa]
MIEPDFDEIRERWENFRAKLREFYVHWIEEILKRHVEFKDPSGNPHYIWVRNNESIGLFTKGVTNMVRFYGLEGQYFVDLKYNGDRKFDIHILDINEVEIQYPPLPNQPPVVLPPSPNVPPNEEHPQMAPNVNAPQVPPNEEPPQMAPHVNAPQVPPNEQPAQYIPAHVVDIMLGRRQQWLDLIDTAGDRVHAIILRKKKRSRNERYLGWGWYTFCRNLDVQVGDTMQFRFYGNAYELHVSVI